MSGPLVLVVDDDPDVLVYIGSLLEDHGYRVRTAPCCRDALTAVAVSEPDLVLIDVLMPGRSGLDLLVTLRSDRRWSRLPLVVMTGMEQVLQDDCQSYLGSHHGVRGPDAVLGKPLDPRTLLAVIAHLAHAAPPTHDSTARPDSPPKEEP